MDVMGTKPFFINVSQVASFIGRNKFVPLDEAWSLMWRKVSERSYAAALQRCGFKTDEQVFADVLQKEERVRRKVDETMSNTHTTSSGVQKSLKRALDPDDLPKLSERETRVVRSQLRKNLFTKYGQDNESVTFEELRQTFGVVAKKASDTYYKKSLGVIEEYECFLGGKIDGLADEGHTLVEIKNRVHRLFKCVKDYERVQVVCYLSLLPVISKALLVEVLRQNNTSPPEMNMIEIVRNEEDIHEIDRALKRNLRVLFRFIKNPEQQDAFFVAEDRALFLSRVIEQNE
jgi:hypothetical protein